MFLETKKNNTHPILSKIDSDINEIKCILEALNVKRDQDLKLIE